MAIRAGNVLAAVAAFVVLIGMACSNNSDEEVAPPPLVQAKSTVAPTIGIWQPAIGTSWQWQINTGDIDISFNVSADLVSRLHAQGRNVICYMNAGSWEEWRPDVKEFPGEALGKVYDGWEGERWLDIRNIDALAPTMRARLDLCTEKGFDAIEPDNIDGYTNDTSFPLTYNDQLMFNQWLVDEAHQRGLSIGLKNDAEQASDLVDYFDWALTEDYVVEGWCTDMAPFLEGGEAVFTAEYTDTGVLLAKACGEGDALGLSVILEDRELDAKREAC